MKHLFLISFFCLSIVCCFAQQVLSPEVIASQGGTFQSPTLEVSYTVGEMAAINTITGNSFILTQGFHQPDKFVVITVNEIDSDLGLLVFPNPANAELNIKLNIARNQQFKVECFDAAGRLIGTPFQINHLPGEQNYLFNISGLAPGAYLLRLSDAKSGTTQVVKFTKLLN